MAIVVETALPTRRSVTRGYIYEKNKKVEFCLTLRDRGFLHGHPDRHWYSHYEAQSLLSSIFAQLRVSFGVYLANLGKYLP